MSKIEKIRQEIERQRRYAMDAKYPKGSIENERATAIVAVCLDLLTFLDTLSEEPAPKGYDEAYLNEKIAKASETWRGVDVDKYMDEVRGREPDKSLEEAAEEYASINCDDYVDYESNICFIEEGMRVAFKAGAEWQAEQFEKNRLAHCDALSKKDCDRETDFAMEIIEKEHRQPTFSDAIKYGMRLQKDALLEWLDGKMTIEGATEGFVGGYDSALKDVIEYINEM